ncbi:hypothetical protein [Moraxella sp. ZY210820]|uniref:hypothetical protein n=1 Tax=unclassified Moraxella TaxID=2685852 RepID=UPI00272EF188|nr:hypothetical protein [Moraxella sp. ZY210820]WLF83786.1 hypothetical protein LU301_11160 [Moraxella sp. ZY210820]
MFDNKFDYLDLLKFLNNKNLSYDIVSHSSKPATIDGNVIASALADLDDWVQAWAYILANHHARSTEMYLCQRVLMSIIYAEMAHLNIGESRKLIHANNIAWGVMDVQTSKRTNASIRDIALACDMDKQTYYRTYTRYYQRAEQEIATWESIIREAIKIAVIDK